MLIHPRPLRNKINDFLRDIINNLQATTTEQSNERDNGTKQKSMILPTVLLNSDVKHCAVIRLTFMVQLLQMNFKDNLWSISSFLT